MDTNNTNIISSPFLDSFKGENTRVPVWFMRQAGRYLPEYMALKEKNSLSELFLSPELAAEITCMPIDLIGVDAAILFADILTLPQSMGINIHFDDKKGPLLDQNFNIDRIHDITEIPHITEIIQLVKKRLGPTPLIGFAGSPFTVATYIIEGGSSTNFKKTLKVIMNQPEVFHQLMSALTKNTITYYKMQKQAGIDAFQLFDTWVGILRPQDYARLVLPYIEEIFEAIDIPSIYFAKNSNSLLAFMDKTQADFLSVDHTVVIGHHKTLEHTNKGIQGNLFNGLLYSDPKTIQREVNDILIGGKKHGKFIFNLSHGVFPDVDPNVLKSIVEQVHAFNWKNE